MVGHGNPEIASERGVGTVMFRGNGISNFARSPIAKRRCVVGKRLSGNIGGDPIPTIAYAKRNASVFGVKNDASKIVNATATCRTKPVAPRRSPAALYQRYGTPSQGR